MKQEASPTAAKPPGVPELESGEHVKITQCQRARVLKVVQAGSHNGTTRLLRTR